MYPRQSHQMNLKKDMYKQSMTNITSVKSAVFFCFLWHQRNQLSTILNSARTRKLTPLLISVDNM